MMGIELTVAIVAAAASLVVGTTGLVTALLTSRQSRLAQREVELLKSTLDRERARDELRDEQLKAATAAMDGGIRDIQLLKDFVQMITAAKGTGLDAKSALTMVSKARDAIATAYGESYAQLTEAEAEAFHRAKNEALVIESMLHRELSGLEYVSELSEANRGWLTERRGHLTDLQHRLRDSRWLRMSERLQRSP